MDSGSERYQKTKQHFEEFEKMPVTIKDIIKKFYSKEFISILENKSLEKKDIFFQKKKDFLEILPFKMLKLILF